MNRYKQTSWRAFLCAALLAALSTLAACGGGGPAVPEVQPQQFVVMAKSAACTENRNRLYLIDNKYVFWDSAGNCPYSSPAYKLYAQTPSDLLCTYTMKPGGAFILCNDTTLSSLFDTLVTHADKADLGLGAGHTVAPIPF